MSRFFDDLDTRSADARAADWAERLPQVIAAAQGTSAGAARLAFLVNPVRVPQIIAVADAGEVLPQKSTFFYPKLGTGLVLNVVD